MGSNPKQPIVYDVFLTRRCEKRYNNLQNSETRDIDVVISQLRIDPRLGYPLKDPSLKDLFSIHACQNKFRIIYKFTDNPAEIEIWAIELRKHVYEELARYRTSIKELARVILRNAN